MKAAHKILKIIIAVLMLTLGNQVKAQEQGYQWSKWYEGQRRQGSGVSMDEIIDSYIDSLGNTYVFGQFGKDARMGGLDAPYICPMDTISDYSYMVGNSTGIFLAKIDSAGNVLWWKWARNGSQNSLCHPWNMVVKDNLITIAFNNAFGSEFWNWFYCFDTMLIEPNPVWGQDRPGVFTTYFVTFDFDGNIVDVHDMRLFAIRGIGTPLFLSPCSLISYYDSRFVIDEDNNIHIFSCSEFAMEDSFHKAYIIVDGDTNRKYPLNVNTMNGIYFSSSVYYKMDSNWTLQTSRYMIDSIAGWQHEHLGPALANLHFHHVVVEGDELYINGLFECKDAYYVEEELADSATFAATIYLDSIHFLKAACVSDFRLMPFLIKMNKAGNIEWVQQIYSETPESNHSAIYLFGQKAGGLALDKNNVYTNCSNSDGSDFFTEPTYIFLDSEHTIPIRVPVIETNLTTCYDRNTGTPVDFYIHDSVNKSLYGDLAIVGDEIILHDAFTLLGKTVIGKINKHTKEVTNVFPIDYGWIIGSDHMSISDNGWIFRGEHGDRTYVNDSIFVGNYSESAVMTFYYDSSLDLRRRPCPQVDSLWGSISGMVATLFWNGQSGIADYELSYIPEGGNWDNAFTFETSDTSASLTLLYDRCYQFRIRGHCTRKGKPYSSWSEPFTICPEAGIGDVAATGSLSLSPNPATGQVQILGLTEKARRIEVLDMPGRVLLTFTDTTSFDITPLPQGSYLVKVQTQEDQTYHLKLVKQ